MSSVDNRIVNMKFDNASFERGVSTTMSSLSKLEQSLQFKNAGAGLAGAQSAVDKFHMGTIEGAVTRVSSSFIAMSTVAITALSNITNKAINAGTNLAKALTIDPVGAGFKEFELKMGSIQTIMAGSGESLQTVNKYLQQLNEYSDKTIYSFADMTTNIGKFTNAGISLKDSVASIQGVANVAALSGANADEASRAMYNFAQALSSGSVKLADWKSIELANLGTKEFKQQLIDSAVAAGTLQKTTGGMYKTLKGTPINAIKGFNESLTDGWLTTEALTKTLGRYADTNTDVGKRATAAASDIKTFSQMVDTLKESAGSGWAETWEIVFGNFEEGKKLWTGLGDFFGGVIKSSADARNKLLTDWKKLGGQKDLIAGIKNVFSALGDVVRPIKEAFRDIFPAMTGQRLAELTKNFREFTEKLKVGDDTIQKIKATFRGLFAIFSIVRQVIGGVISTIGAAFGALSSGADGAGGGFLSITAKIGDFLSHLDEMLKKSGAIKNFFGRINEVISGLGEKFTAARESVGSIIPSFETISGVLDKVRDAFLSIFSIFDNVDSDAATSAVKSGLFAGILAAIGLFIKNLSGMVKEATGIFSDFGGMFGSVSGVLNQVTSNLKTMQQSVKADILLKIAASIALLAVAILLLSTVDADDLAKSLVAVATMLAMLIAAIKQLDKAVGVMGTAKLTLMGAGLIALAIALTIMAGAVALYGNMETDTLVRGLTAIAGILAIIIAATAVLSKSGGAAQMLVSAASILVLSAALTAFAGALKLYSTLDTKTMAKSGLKIAAALTAISLVMRLMPKNLILTAAGLLIVATALTILAGALKIMGSMSGGEMAKSLVMLGASLLIIAVGLNAMNGAIAGAAAILIFAAALVILIPPLLVLANLSWAQLGMALVSLAAIFTVLGVAGLLLGPVVPIILLLGVAIALLGVGAMAAGVGLFLFAAGLSLLATAGAAGIALLVMAVEALAGLIPMILTKVAEGLIQFALVVMEAVPELLEAFGKMLDAILKFIREYAPKLYDTVFDLIEEFLDAAVDRMPSIIKKGGELVIAFIKGIGEQQLAITKAAGETLLKFLEGMTKWLNDNQQRIHDVGHDLAQAIIEGVIAGIGGLSGGVFDAIGGLASGALNRAKEVLHINSPSKDFIKIGESIPEGMKLGIDDGTGMVNASVEDMGNSAIDTMRDTMKNMSEAIRMDIESEPVIAPVLDLTQFRAGASAIQSMLAVRPVAADVSFDQAAGISSIRNPATDETVSTTDAASIVFEQNNYSPKALSPLEIYRNTRNQISLAKEVLAG